MAHLFYLQKFIPGVFENPFRRKAFTLQRLGLASAVFILLFWLNRFNYLLFHSVVETFSVVVTGAIFMFAWNARHFLATSYFTLIGLGYLAVSILDFLHIFTYPGMTVIPNLKAADAGIQLWIAARFVESASLLTALGLVRRKVNDTWLPLIPICCCLLISASILVWPVFPTCYVSGKGLTPFKIGSEYVIILILLTCAYFLYRRRQIFEPNVLWFLMGAVWVTIASELAFTLYIDVDSSAIVAGHFLKFISVFLIYLAIVQTGVMKPYRLVVNALKQRETALADKEAKFRLLVEKIEGAFWIASVDLSKILYISPGYEKIWQRSCDQLYSDPDLLRKSIHPEDRRRVIGAMTTIAKEGWDLEFRITRPNGGIRWIRDYGYPVYDADGHIVQLCGMTHDITPQKQMEQNLLKAGQTLEQRVAARTNALSTVIGHLKQQVGERSKIGAELKERNLMLKTLVQAIPDMVSYKDLQGRYLIANSAYRHFFGLKGSTVIGKTDKRSNVENLTKGNVQRERMALEMGKSIRFESMLRSAAGCSSHWDIRKIPVKDGHGDMVGVLSLARDISAFKQREFELQQSKAMLRVFLDGISDPMFMVNDTLEVIYLNRAAVVAYGQGSPEGKPRICPGILCNKDGRCETCRVEELMKKRMPASFELSRDGSDRVEKIYIYPFSDEGFGLEGAVVRIADITEAKGLERHLIHTEKMTALGMLVGGMVHEINNPNSFISFNLPILRAYLEKIFRLLDSHPAISTHKDWFGMDYQAFRREVFGLTDNLSHGSTRIDNIISNLKAMTHPKPTPTRKIRVDLLGIVDKAVVLCRSEIRKRVKVFEVTPSQRTIFIKTDPEAIEQVIINLLINASHAADKRDSWVRIEVGTSEDRFNHAVIEVSDNGCGMNKETMASIFDPFFTTKGPGVGTGLGLSVSYNLIRQLGGEILVDSKPDQGTRFKVVLPDEAEDGPTLGRENPMGVDSLLAK